MITRRSLNLVLLFTLAVVVPPRQSSDAAGAAPDAPEVDDAQHGRDIELVRDWVYRLKPPPDSPDLERRLEAWVAAHPAEPEGLFFRALYVPSDAERFASETALARLRRAADLGYPPARAHLGMLLYRGTRVPKDER